MVRSFIDKKQLIKNDIQQWACILCKLYCNRCHNGIVLSIFHPWAIFHLASFKVVMFKNNLCTTHVLISTCYVGILINFLWCYPQKGTGVGWSFWRCRDRPLQVFRWFKIYRWATACNVVHTLAIYCFHHHQCKIPVSSMCNRSYCPHNLCVMEK